MPVRRTIHESQGIYFITFTCARWLKLFQLTNSYDLVYNWFNYLINQGHYIIGYTIMPDHVHALIAFRNSGKNINTIVGNGKRFIAYGLVERLNQGGFSGILDVSQYIKRIQLSANYYRNIKLYNKSTLQPGIGLLLNREGFG